MKVKDSGIREEMETGSVRDTQVGKPRPDLIPPTTLLKLGIHYEQGARKYDPSNWKRGQHISRYIASFDRHWLKWKAGICDEPHLMAAIWNLFSIDWTLDAIECGILPEDLDDRLEDAQDNNRFSSITEKIMEEVFDDTHGRDYDNDSNTGDYRLYIAGKMRGVTFYNFDAFFKAEEQLRELGFNNICNPARLDLERGFNPYNLPEDHNWDEYPSEDLAIALKDDLNIIINQIDTMYMLRGWEESEGAILEHNVAKMLRKRIIYQEEQV